MPAVASLREAARPSVVYETALRDATLSIDWYTLADAKAHLGIPLASTQDDGRIAALVSDAIGTIELYTGRTLARVDRVAEYRGVQGQCGQVATMVVDVPDATIRSLVAIDTQGVETARDLGTLTIAYGAGLPIVRISAQASYIDTHEDVWARIGFSTQLRQASREASIVRGLLNATVKHSFAEQAPGTADPRNTAAFKRGIAALADMSGMARSGRDA